MYLSVLLIIWRYMKATEASTNWILCYPHTAYHSTYMQLYVLALFMRIFAHICIYSSITVFKRKLDEEKKMKKKIMKWITYFFFSFHRKFLLVQHFSKSKSGHFACSLGWRRKKKYNKTICSKCMWIIISMSILLVDGEH